MPHSLLGKWVGGPYNSTFILAISPTGAHGKFKCPSGKWGTMEGIFMSGGQRFRGTYVDPDAGGGGSHGNPNTVDINLDSSGSGWTAHAMSGGQRTSWSGRKPTWKKSSDVKVWYKDRTCWERLLTKKLVDNPEWLELQRRKLLTDSFDEQQRLRKNALLSEAANLAVGDGYRDIKVPRDTRHRGRSFVAGRSKFQTRHNGYFSIPKPLAAGEKYVDAMERRRRVLASRRSASAKFERPAFKPSGAKEIRQSAPGYLTVVDKNTDQATMDAILKDIASSKVKPTKREVEVGPRNFLTNPPREGHYGQPGSLLGHRTREAAALFTHSDEPYERQREIQRRERAKARKMLADRDLKPFRAANPNVSRTFTKDSEIFKPVRVPVPPPRKDKRNRPQSAPQAGRATRASSIAAEERPVWKPNNPAKRGPLSGTFGGVPKYIPQPEPAKQLKVRHDDSKDEPAWAPNPTGRPPRPVNTVMLNMTNVRRAMRRRPKSARPMRTYISSNHGASRGMVR